MSQERPAISRRRLLVGTGAGAAAVWAAPAISTLGSASAAGSECIVYDFNTQQLTNPGPGSPTWTFGVGSTFTANGYQLTVDVGEVDIVGPNTPWTTGFPTPGNSIDLAGSHNDITTILNTPNFAAGSYHVHVELVGSVGGEQNIVFLTLGSNSSGVVPVPGGISNPTVIDFDTTVTGPVAIPLQFSHQNGNDNQGAFLRRLTISQTSC